MHIALAQNASETCATVLALRTSQMFFSSHQPLA